MSRCKGVRLKTILNDAQVEALARDIGRCMETLEKIQMDRVTLSLVKDVVKKSLRETADDMVKASDE